MRGPVQPPRGGAGAQAPFGGLRPRHTEARALERWRAIVRAILRLGCIGLYTLGFGRVIAWALF
jgi:hypothetical protein